MTFSINGTRVYRFKSDAAAKNGVVNAKPTVLKSIIAHNTNASIRYLRIYNKATAPATSDTPVMEIALPANGAPVNLPFDDLAFSAGLSFRAVTGAADNDDTACASNEVVANFEYV